MANKYSTIVQWSEADEAFVAIVPEFPHLSSFGNTPDEALAELRGVIDDVVDILQQQGRELPVPYQLLQSSGQFRVRLPRSLHQRLVDRARVEGVSLNQLVMSMLAEGLGRRVGNEAEGSADGQHWPVGKRRPARSA